MRLLGIDHLVLAVSDLAAAGRAFARLGFALTPRGSHPQWGTANHCVMFQQGYLELLAAPDEGGAARSLSQFLGAHGEGLYRLALGATDIEANHDGFAAEGLAVGRVENLSRRISTPEGWVELGFRYFDIDPSAAAGLPAFVISHLTPEAMRRPEWLAHANGARGIKSLTAVVDSPESHIPEIERLFGRGSAIVTDNLVAVHTGNGVLFLIRPDEFTQLHPEANLDGPPAVPSLAALTLLVADTQAAARHLEAGGVPFSQDTKGNLRIPPSAACGVLLELTDRP